MAPPFPHSTELTSPDPSDTTLWLIDLDADPAAWDAALLDPREQARAARFRFEVHARRYRASHAGLRLILGQATGIAPRTLAFTEGPHGKPRLALSGAPHFNLSHSGGWALVGLSANHPIGVDIELPTVTDTEALARHHFSTAEHGEFQRTPNRLQAQAFLRCWTRKEACLKALGSGLSVEPGSFEAGLEAAPRDTSIPFQGRSCAMRVVSIALPLQAPTQAQAAVALVSPGSHHLSM